MKSGLVILSGFLVLFGLILAGAAIEHVDFSDPFNTYTIRSVIGYVLFMTGAFLAFVGSWSHRG